MTLPFAMFSLSDSTRLLPSLKPTWRTFRPSQLSGAILSVPVDDHFSVIAEIRRCSRMKADDRSAKSRVRRPAAPHPVSFTPSFALIHPTPQEAINVPFTFVF
jgi:hypothetical protein